MEDHVDDTLILTSVFGALSSDMCADQLLNCNMWKSLSPKRDAVLTSSCSVFVVCSF